MKPENTLRDTKEKRVHSSTLLPYSYYECRIPELFVNVPTHWHSEFELNLVRSGRGEFFYNDTLYQVSAGDIFIVAPDVLHAVYPGDSDELIYDALVFNKVMLGTGSNDRSSAECIMPIVNGSHKLCTRIPRDSADYPEFLRLTERIFECVKENKPHYDLLMKSCIMQFFWLLENSDSLIEKGNADISYSNMMRPSLEYMNDHFAEKISVDELAELVHLSKSYYMWCFKKAVGIGAIEYLTQLRIKAALNLLQTTESSISDIALQCGYGNLSNFNRQFKRIVGCSPNQYRGQFRE